MKTTISSKGQLVLPAEFRRLDGLKAGQEFEVERLDKGEYRLRRVEAGPNEGLVDWLLDCPVKGFLGEKSTTTETTDDIQPDFR
jgi:AbrB family looped-hinge helix DNA binding protein